MINARVRLTVLEKSFIKKIVKDYDTITDTNEKKLFSRIMIKMRGW